MSRLWDRHFVFAMPRASDRARMAEKVLDTELRVRFKSLLTLLELTGASLHDEKIEGRGAQGMDRHGGIRNGKRGIARPAPRRRIVRFGPGGYRHRGGRHGRRRRLHQPWLSGQGHPLRLFDPVAVGRRRHRRAVRRVCLQRTRRDVSALERRIQFPDPRLSSGLRISGGLGVGDGRICGAGRAGRDGVRRIRQIGAAGRAAAGACHRRGLAGVAGATRRRQALAAPFN